MEIRIQHVNGYTFWNAIGPLMDLEELLNVHVAFPLPLEGKHLG